MNSERKMEAHKDLNRTPTIEVLYEANAVLGEGPFYEEDTGLLLWVDVFKKEVNFLDPVSRTNKSVEIPGAVSVSSVVPVEGSDLLLVLVGCRACLVHRESGAISEELGSVEDGYPANRFNDAKCDSYGRLWAGTYSLADPSVKDRGCGLYSISNGVITRHCDAILSNGLAWNLSDDTMYFVDSLKKAVFRFKYNREDGRISDQKVLVDYKSYPELGLPDGMCTDSKGRLWVVGFGAHKVTCWEPQTGKRVMDVDVPGAKHITSCCFGGPNYEWMFLTSSTAFLGADEGKDFPHNGAVFVIKDLGTRGLPPHKYKTVKGHCKKIATSQI